MTDHITESSPLIVARIAGILYLLMAPFGVFGILYVRANLIVPGDAATTANNIMASEALFRSGIVSALITQIIFILLVLFLYRLLKPVNRNHALLMVVLALVGIPIAMLNELNQFAALHLLSGADYLTAFTTDQLHTQVLFFLNLHSDGILIAQIFWGLWLFPLGLLVFKSGFLPRFLGVLLVIGCFGYVIDSFALILFPGFKPIAQFTFIGELLLPLWLLIKGVNVEQWEKLALESA
ncbi:MAG: DUF4386 domain-containing protein [Candidatus Marinimicrobia bacterium]|nr:DUF4386 domain-containing protein [Candidatus Neomarinimicrobiota bacterium]